MSFSINGSWLLFALIPLGVLLIGVGATPRWLIRSLSKHALWRLRDDVVDDVIAKRLDGNHPAVVELVRRAEWAIEESRSFDLLHLLVWRRAWRDLPRERLRSLARIPDLAGLSEDEADCVSAYRLRYDSVAIRALFLSSWFGIAIVFKVAVPTLLGALTRKPMIGEVRVMATVRGATDEVAIATSIGHAAQDFVTVKGPALNPLPVAA